MDEQTCYSLLVDLHRDGARQGPGSEAETRRAIELARLDHSAELAIADIGCGTGAATRVLAESFPKARITAVDLFPEFLNILAERADHAGCRERIDTLAASMDSLPLKTGSLDLIWSEGAIYHMGFGEGVAAWRPLLRPGGVIAVSEITWLRPNPPDEIREHWQAEYPQIATAAEKIAILEGAGYDLLGYFVLPATAWLEGYYVPTGKRIPGFLARHANSPDAREIACLDRQEAGLYERFQDWFSYGFYVARRR